MDLPFEVKRDVSLNKLFAQINKIKIKLMLQSQKFVRKIGKNIVVFFKIFCEIPWNEFWLPPNIFSNQNDAHSNLYENRKMFCVPFRQKFSWVFTIKSNQFGKLLINEIEIYGVWVDVCWRIYREFREENCILLCGRIYFWFSRSHTSPFTVAQDNLCF